MISTFLTIIKHFQTLLNTQENKNFAENFVKLIIPLNKNVKKVPESLPVPSPAESTRALHYRKLTVAISKTKTEAIFFIYLFPCMWLSLMTVVEFHSVAFEIQ